MKLLCLPALKELKNISEQTLTSSIIITSEVFFRIFYLNIKNP